MSHHTFPNSPNGLLLADIDPKRADKYSPNLYKFLKRTTERRMLERAEVWEMDGVQYIGFMDGSDWFIGVRLFRVLCEGNRSSVRSMAHTLKCIEKMERVEGFWPEYVRIGRCAIDPKHSHVFTSKEPRYDYPKKDRRVCRWCGAEHRLKTWTEKVKREAWESYTDEMAKKIELYGKIE